MAKAGRLFNYQKSGGAREVRQAKTILTVLGNKAKADEQYKKAISLYPNFDYFKRCYKEFLEEQQGSPEKCSLDEAKRNPG